MEPQPSILVIKTFDRKVASIAGYGIVGIFLGLYCLSVNNLTILLTINVIIPFVCAVLTLEYLTESPHWLNANHRVKEAVAVLRAMAEINRTTEHFNKFYEVNKELVLHSNERANIHGTKYSVLDLFKAEMDLGRGNVCFFYNRQLILRCKIIIYFN